VSDSQGVSDTALVETAVAPLNPPGPRAPSAGPAACSARLLRAAISWPIFSRAGVIRSAMAVTRSAATARPAAVSIARLPPPRPRGRRVPTSTTDVLTGYDPMARSAHTASSPLRTIRNTISRFASSDLSRGPNEAVHVLTLAASSLRALLQRLCELAHQTHQVRNVFRSPVLKDPPCQALAGLVKLVSYGLAFGRHHRFAYPAIFRILMPHHHLHAFQLGNLPADGRVIPAQAIRQIHHADRAHPFDYHQQAKKRLVQLHAGFRDQPFIVARAVHHAHDRDQGPMEILQLRRNMCILHFIFDGHKLPS